MSDTAKLGPWVRRLLLEHLVSERNLARNTQRSYRDTLALLIPFIAGTGQIKEARGFRRFLLRGLERVQAEWQMICATHNLLKLFCSGWGPQRA